MKSNKKNIISKLILIIVIVISISPFLIMFFGSFKSNASLSSLPPNLSPTDLTIKNYEYVFKKGITDSLKNSIIVSSLTTLIVIIIDSLAGYVLARKEFTGKRAVFILLLCTMMIPKQILMVPTFILLTKIGLYDSLIGTVLSSSAVPFGVFLIKQRMEQLPKEVFDAADLDGATEIQKYVKVALPLSASSVFALGIFVFVQTWNDFMWQLVTLTSKTNLTLPLFLSNLIAEKSAMAAYQFAGSVISTIPIIAVFLYFNKYFINDSTSGSVKG